MEIPSSKEISVIALFSYSNVHIAPGLYSKNTFPFTFKSQEDHPFNIRLDHLHICTLIICTYTISIIGIIIFSFIDQHNIFTRDSDSVCRYIKRLLCVIRHNFTGTHIHFIRRSSAFRFCSLSSEPIGASHHLQEATTDMVVCVILCAWHNYNIVTYSNEATQSHGDVALRCDGSQYEQTTTWKHDSLIMPFMLSSRRRAI